MNLDLPVQISAGSAKAINGSDAQLIWELVAAISPPAEVLSRYGLTPVDLRTKMKDKMFRAAYSEARTLWNSDLNVEERVKLKARFMVEDGLLDIFKILKSDQMPGSMKMEAFDRLAKVGDLGPKKVADGAGGKAFSIAINFTNTDKKVVIDGHTLPAEADA